MDFTFIDKVRAVMAERGVTANVVLGRRARWIALNQGAGGANRVVFQPGDDSGRMGRLAGAHQPGRRADGARALVNTEITYLVSVWAVDKSKPSDEAAQLRAARDLLEHVVEAMAVVATGQHEWGAVALTPEPHERAFGAEFRAELIYRSPLRSTPEERVFPASVITSDLRESAP